MHAKAFGINYKKKKPNHEGCLKKAFGWKVEEEDAG